MRTVVVRVSCVAVTETTRRQTYTSSGTQTKKCDGPLNKIGLISIFTHTLVAGCSEQCGEWRKVLSTHRRWIAQRSVVTLATRQNDVARYVWCYRVRLAIDTTTNRGDAVVGIDRNVPMCCSLAGLGATPPGQST